MHEIEVKKVTRFPGDLPSMVEQTDGLLEELMVEVHRLAANHPDLAPLEEWLRFRRDKFWEKQALRSNNPADFWARIPLPGIAGKNIRVVAADGRIEVRDDAGFLIREIPLPLRVDARDISAVLDTGYLHLTVDPKVAPAGALKRRNAREEPVRIDRTA